MGAVFYLLWFILVFEGLCKKTVDEEFDKDIIQRKVTEQLDSFYDLNVDYGYFKGRMTDKDKSKKLLKITSENKNIRFFQAGDEVSFHLLHQRHKKCKGYVRQREKDYFIIYVKDLGFCESKDIVLRRGGILHFETPILRSRVRDASIHRRILINRRQHFLRQLNEVNHFLWSYEQQKVATAIEYDEKILALRHARRKGLDKILYKKRDNIKLKNELIKRLDKLDEDIEFYRIDVKKEFNRWRMDRDMGLPVSRHPPLLKKIERIKDPKDL